MFRQCLSLRTSLTLALSRREREEPPTLSPFGRGDGVRDDHPGAMKPPENFKLRYDRPSA